ncbi:MAG: iron-containing alcohol dehydrogenase [Sedimentisphaerales bacterium]|nr:iron-containing alcohol dehydrogenase [Sedimentisphaerales bacterium]
MKFEFATATRIIFGSGTASEAVPIASEMGKHACIVTGNSIERVRFLIEQLREKKIECVTFSVSGEPTTAIVKSGTEAARTNECDFVISIGGGSVLDTGKAIAAMLTNHGELEDYLEVVGKGKPLTNRAAPHIAIPTTAGTGAEVTRNAVLGVPEYQVKVSMRSQLMIPTIAIVDPMLTYSMPPYVTAYTGLDALTQLIEAFVSNKSNPMTDGICREGITADGRSLQKAYENGHDANAREDMSLAGLFGGLALANAGLGAVHGFAGPLGGMIPAPHGAICASLLPFVIETNVQALKARKPDSKSLERYNIIAQILTNNPNAQAADAVEWIKNLCTVLHIPSLEKLGLKKQAFAEVVSKAHKSSSMKGNPIELTDVELAEILEKAFDNNNL